MFGKVYWSWFSQTPIPSSLSSEDISFEWYGLQNSIIKSILSGDLSSGSVSYSTSEVPQDNWTIFQSRFWREKTIKISGEIVCNSQIELEAKIDEIRGKLSTPEGVLRYRRWDGSFREIHATLVNEPITREHYNLSWIPFEFEFKSNDPFWRNSVPESRIYSGITSNLLESITSTGSEKTPPQTYFYFNSASGVTSVALTIQWRTITYTGSLAAGDLLVFDGINKVVTKNNVLQDFDGVFPNLSPWANPTTYTINGTFSVDISTVFYNLYR